MSSTLGCRWSPLACAARPHRAIARARPRSRRRWRRPTRVPGRSCCFSCQVVAVSSRALPHRSTLAAAPFTRTCFSTSEPRTGWLNTSTTLPFSQGVLEQSTLVTANRPAKTNGAPSRSAPPGSPETRATMRHPSGICFFAANRTMRRSPSSRRSRRGPPASRTSSGSVGRIVRVESHFMAIVPAPQLSPSRRVTSRPLR